MFRQACIQRVRGRPKWNRTHPIPCIELHDYAQQYARTPHFYTCIMLQWKNAVCRYVCTLMCYIPNRHSLRHKRSNVRSNARNIKIKKKCSSGTVISVLNCEPFPMWKLTRRGIFIHQLFVHRTYDESQCIFVICTGFMITNIKVGLRCCGSPSASLSQFHPYTFDDISID